MDFQKKKKKRCNLHMMRWWVQLVGQEFFSDLFQVPVFVFLFSMIRYKGICIGQVGQLSTSEVRQVSVREVRT